MIPKTFLVEICTEELQQNSLKEILNEFLHNLKSFMEDKGYVIKEIKLLEKNKKGYLCKSKVFLLMEEYLKGGVKLYVGSEGSIVKGIATVFIIYKGLKKSEITWFSVKKLLMKLSQKKDRKYSVEDGLYWLVRSIRAKAMVLN